MYRNNKGNLWLRTICITVALLGMLFFTHSQFSSATAPSFIEMEIEAASGDSSPLDATESFSFIATISLPPGDTIASTDPVTVTYAIGTATGKTVALSTHSIPSTYIYNGGVQIEEGDNGAITFTKITFKTSSTGATPIDYTTESTSSPVVTVMGTISADTIEDIADVASVAVGITNSGTGTDVLIGESVNVEVTVGSATEGVPDVANNAMKGDATDHKLSYKIGASGSPTDLALLRGDNDTHFTGMLPVTSSSTAGAFTFESVKLSLQNGDGDADPAEVKTYTTETTSDVVVSLTDAGLTLILKYAVTDVTSVAVGITNSISGTDVTVGETIDVDVIVVNSAQGVAVVANNAMKGDDTVHTLQYKIGESGASTDLALLRGDNDTHFTGMLPVGLGTIAGVFTFESVKLSLQNGAGDALSTKVKTYTTETTSDVVVSLTDAGLTTDPTSDITILTNATAVNNKAGVGDKVTFTAWITNTTDGIPLNVTVNYKITGAKNTTGFVLLTNQGLNGTSTTTDLWTGILTITDNTTAGNLTIVSIFVWLKNMDSSQTVNLTITAADAMATNVVEVGIPAPVATTTSAAATATSSSVTISDSPVSIFAVFILIASVSMAVGVYTLRRKQ